MTGGSAAPRDPGLEYLYQHPQHPTTQQSSKAESMLVMNPLPRNDRPLDEQGPGRDWAGAMGNMETAKLAMETLRGLMVDAVFLDEDAYTNAATLQLYQQRLQVAIKLPEQRPTAVVLCCCPAHTIIPIITMHTTTWFHGSSVVGTLRQKLLECAYVIGRLISCRHTYSCPTATKYILLTLPFMQAITDPFWPASAQVGPVGSVEQFG